MQSLTANRELIGQKVRLEADPLIDQASDGAWIRYVWLIPDEAAESEEADPDTILVNEKIIENGWGFLHASAEMLYGTRMQAAGKYAAATNKGLWSQCEVAKDEATGLLMTQELVPSDDTEPIK